MRGKNALLLQSRKVVYVRLKHSICRKFFLVRVCFLFLGLSSVQAQAEGDIQYTFDHSDTTYLFEGKMYLPLDIDCVLPLCFEFKHIQAMGLASREVVLLQKGPNWNQIKYTLSQSQFYVNESVWNRYVDRERHRVDFEMLYSHSSRKVMPQVISSSGHYELIRTPKGICVTYVQRGTMLEQHLTPIYFIAIKYKAAEFLEVFYAYAMAHCGE